MVYFFNIYMVVVLVRLSKLLSPAENTAPEMPRQLSRL